MEKPADFRLGQTLYFGVSILEMRRCTVLYFGLGSREDRSPPPRPAGPGPALRPAAVTPPGAPRSKHCLYRVVPPPAGQGQYLSKRKLQRNQYLVRSWLGHFKIIVLITIQISKQEERVKRGTKTQSQNCSSLVSVPESR